MHWECYMEATELRAYGANNDSLWSGSLNDEPANHHVVARLNKRAGGNVSESCSCWRKRFAGKP